MAYAQGPINGNKIIRLDYAQNEDTVRFDPQTNVTRQTLISIKALAYNLYIQLLKSRLYQARHGTNHRVLDHALPENSCNTVLNGDISFSISKTSI